MHPEPANFSSSSQATFDHNPDVNSLVDQVQGAFSSEEHRLQDEYQQELNQLKNLPGPLQRMVRTEIEQSGPSALAPDPFDGKGVQDVSPSGIDQAGLGDCFFDSALASLANTDNGRQIIHNMIQTNADGSYTVTFPGDKGNPVSISQQDLQQNLNKGNVADSKLWARIIETALLKYDGAAQYATGLNLIQNEGMPVFGDVYSAADALHLLTNQSVASDSLGLVNSDNGRSVDVGSVSMNNVRHNLEQAMNNNEPVTANAAAGGLGPFANSSDGMVGNHVYSVLSYNPNTDMVVVRNPWGTNNGTPYQSPGVTKYGVTSLQDGELQMSLKTFVSRFNQVTYAGQNPDGSTHDANNGNTASTLGNLAWRYLNPSNW